jgi:hypothetical protein
MGHDLHDALLNAFRDPRSLADRSDAKSAPGLRLDLVIAGSGGRDRNWFRCTIEKIIERTERTSKTRHGQPENPAAPVKLMKAGVL